MLKLFERLGDTGKITNKQKFKKVDDGLWEFKSYQVRFLGDFRPDRRFVVAHGVRKKKDKHLRKDLSKARRILEEDGLRKKGDET